jgi:hypothetical protein
MLNETYSTHINPGPIGIRGSERIAGIDAGGVWLEAKIEIVGIGKLGISGYIASSHQWLSTAGIGKAD